MKELKERSSWSASEEIGGRNRIQERAGPLDDHRYAHQRVVGQDSILRHCIEYTAIEKARSVVSDEEKVKIRGAAYWSVPNRAFSDAAELRFTSKDNDKVHATISFLPPREV